MRKRRWHVGYIAARRVSWRQAGHLTRDEHVARFRAHQQGLIE